MESQGIMTMSGGFALPSLLLGKSDNWGGTPFDAGREPSNLRLTAP